MGTRGAPRATGRALAPLVMVSDIWPIDGYLWAVRIRTEQGDTMTMVIERQLATTETVAMAAHVVASLIATHRLQPNPTNP